MSPTALSGGTLYFAYGANLYRAHMALWCPEAVPVVRAALPAYRLLFRTWADILPSPADRVPGALYELTPRDLAALDTLQGCPDLYRRIHVRVRSERWRFEAMAYRMQSGRPVAPPDPDYLNLILAGYEDWDLDASGLVRSIRIHADP